MYISIIHTFSIHHYGFDKFSIAQLLIFVTVTSSSQESDGDESPKKHSKPTEKSPPIRSPPLEISPEKPVPMEIQHETTEETSGKEEAQHQVPSQVEKKRQIEEKKPTEVEEGPALGRGRRRLFRLEVDSKR